MEFLLDIASLINSTLRISTPLVFAAMAGIFAERSGVIDFSLEGKMLMAAFVAAVGSYYFGNPWIGLLMAIVICVSLSMLHGCLLYTSPSPRDLSTSRMPSSA